MLGSEVRGQRVSHGVTGSPQGLGVRGQLRVGGVMVELMLMGYQWGSYGVSMGCLWGMYGAAMGQLWGLYEAATGQLWGMYGALMGYI